jgi:hypothetical protein
VIALRNESASQAACLLGLRSKRFVLRLLVVENERRRRLWPSRHCRVNNLPLFIEKKRMSSGGGNGGSDEPPRLRGRHKLAAYGHVGARFDAKMARYIGYQRDKRFRDVYERILLRCLKQVQEECMTRKSTIFTIPEQMSSELLPYSVDEVAQYLLVALGEDRRFTVVRMGEEKLYIRWTPPSAAAAEKRPPRAAIIQPPEKDEEVVEDDNDVTTLISTATRKGKKKRGGKIKADPAPSGQPVNARAAVADIDAILASIGK